MFPISKQTFFITCINQIRVVIKSDWNLGKQQTRGKHKPSSILAGLVLRNISVYYLYLLLTKCVCVCVYELIVQLTIILLFINCLSRSSVLCVCVCVCVCVFMSLDFISYIFSLTSY